jgi:spore coat polysaccharide biosynthesis protein SpsF
MTSVIGLVQARMGSSRVPGKAMIDLAGKPLLWHMIDRLRRVPQIGSMVLATTTDPRNAPIVTLARSEGLSVYQHEGEDDLAGRVYGAIRDLEGDLVLKVGGDCPLIDPKVLKGMVDLALNTPGADFVSNRVEWSFPLGLSADVVSRHAIEWSHKNLTKAEDRELFAVYVRDHPEMFRVKAFTNNVDLSHHGWTVDEPEDVVFMTNIFDRLYRSDSVFDMNEVLDYLASKEGTESYAEQ